MNAPRRLGLIGLPFVAVVGVSYISGRPPVLPELSTETFPPARPVNRPPCPVGSAFAFSRTQAYAGIVRSHLKQKLQGLSNIHSGRLRSAVSLLQSIAMGGCKIGASADATAIKLSADIIRLASSPRLLMPVAVQPIAIYSK